ncbi:hypothetical protein HA466_0250500 [Hirschfeldia incana]|nr:hypothetical protein HA466_0250500 [Hirschfeldia incana]
MQRAQEPHSRLGLVGENRNLEIQIKIVRPQLEKRAYIVGYSLEETVKPNVECLVSFGIKREMLPLVVAQQYFFSLKLKIDPEGFARVVEKMPQIVSIKQKVIMKPVEFRLGWAFTLR